MEAVLAPVTPLESPPHAFYDSRKNLIDAAKTFASERGYALVIKRSKLGKVWLKYDRGDSYWNRFELSEEDRIRRTGTRLIDCPVEIIGKLINSTDTWEMTTTNAIHNHDPSLHKSGHPTLRQLGPNEIENVRIMTKAGQPPRVIRTVLQQTNPDLVLRLSDIYNIRARLRVESLAGRTPIQALLQDLTTGALFYRHRTDEEGHVTHLFMAHPRSIELFRKHHDILLLDCTYRTNRYKMPLLNIVGCTGMNTTIQLALVFLCSENENDYIWALTGLREMLGEGPFPAVMVTDRERALILAAQVVFPIINVILCQWHVGKNVIKACKRHFETEETWSAFYTVSNGLINCLSEGEYENQLQEFKTTQPEIPISYCVDTWLGEWKTRLVKVWVDRLPHFGHTVTSRIEGSHAKLKQYLGTSTLDLKGVYDKIAQSSGRCRYSGCKKGAFRI